MDRFLIPELVIAKIRIYDACAVCTDFKNTFNIRRFVEEVFPTVGIDPDQKYYPKVNCLPPNTNLLCCFRGRFNAL